MTREKDTELEHLRREVERLGRLEALEELLPALAGALDVREVFDRVSAIARKVLPHDVLALGLLDDDRRHVRVWAHSGIPAGVRIPERFPLPDPALVETQWEFLLVDDLAETPDAPGGRIIGTFGIRSFLRIPIRLDGELLGGLNFCSLAPGRYSAADVLVGRRIADHLRLALSHERLAKAQRATEEARERAAALARRVETLAAEVEALGGRYRVAGVSKGWKDVLAQATRVAATETTVLLTGESGTGKEVVARFLHRASPRAAGPFSALNCAALPDTLLESELFGYERGAFTGAAAAKPGRLELAAGGVLFLDEVGDANPAVQAKLLRVLQEREFSRLGGTATRRADVRVVAATNRDLRKAIASGELREDLYYRLAVFEIRIPPLRERRDDILPLAITFLEEVGRELGSPPAGLSRDVRDVLTDYAWPGNARELRNVLERAAILCDGGLITREHLALQESRAEPGRPLSGLARPAPPAAPRSAPPPIPGEGLPAVERRLVEEALRDCRYNKSEAARRLGLSRTQLYVRLRRHGLS